MNICVFCGSSVGEIPIYAASAARLGQLLASQGHNLIYGGGNIGLMGILADSVMAHGGQVTGVIPGFLMDREVGHTNITTLEIVSSMHERKKRMADLAEAFVAMPGGWGTLEELAEILTWRQLGLIAHPIGILNINNFFTPLLQQMQRMAKEGFLKNDNMNLLKVAETPEKLLESLN
jgi:uncharacterized protein (TIGR00730 family)